MSILKSFEELDVYKKCKEFRLDIANLAKTLPINEGSKLTSQLLRSSRAITTSIAEGFGRFHHQENIVFCRQSRGSLMETLENLNIAFDEGYIKEETLEKLRNDQQDCLRVLNSYISFLKKAKNRAFEVNQTTPASEQTQFSDFNS